MVSPRPIDDIKLFTDLLDNVSSESDSGSDEMVMTVNSQAITNSFASKHTIVRSSGVPNYKGQKMSLDFEGMNYKHFAMKGRNSGVMLNGILMGLRIFLWR